MLGVLFIFGSASIHLASFCARSGPCWVPSRSSGWCSAWRGAPAPVISFYLSSLLCGVRSVPSMSEEQAETNHIYSTTYLHKLVLTVAAHDKFCRTWDTCWLVNVVNSGCVFPSLPSFCPFSLLSSLLSGFSFTCGSVVEELELLPGQAWVQVFIPMYRWKSQLMDPDLELASCRSVTCLRLWLVRAHSLLFFLSFPISFLLKWQYFEL